MVVRMMELFNNLTLNEVLRSELNTIFVFDIIMFFVFTVFLAVSLSSDLVPTMYTLS